MRAAGVLIMVVMAAIKFDFVVYRSRCDEAECGCPADDGSGKHLSPTWTKFVALEALQTKYHAVYYVFTVRIRVFLSCV